jgi:hypothetical protein
MNDRVALVNALLTAVAKMRLAMCLCQIIVAGPEELKTIIKALEVTRVDPE